MKLVDMAVVYAVDGVRSRQRTPDTHCLMAEVLPHAVREAAIDEVIRLPDGSIRYDDLVYYPVAGHAGRQMRTDDRLQPGEDFFVEAAAEAKRVSGTKLAQEFGSDRGMAVAAAVVEADMLLSVDGMLWTCGIEPVVRVDGARAWIVKAPARVLLEKPAWIDASGRRAFLVPLAAWPAVRNLLGNGLPEFSAEAARAPRSAGGPPVSRMLADAGRIAERAFSPEILEVRAEEDQPMRARTQSRRQPQGSVDLDDRVLPAAAAVLVARRKAEAGLMSHPENVVGLVMKLVDAVRGSRYAQGLEEEVSRIDLNRRIFDETMRARTRPARRLKDDPADEPALRAGI